MQHWTPKPTSSEAVGVTEEETSTETYEENEDGEEESEGEDMPPLIPAEGWEPQLGACVDGGLPSKAVCELSGVLMTDPVATPGGHHYDRAALEDWMKNTQTHPATGAPLTMGECEPASELQGYIQGYQLQMMSACEIVPEAFDDRPLSEVAEAEPLQPMPIPATGLSALDDLPLLPKGEPPKKKNKCKIHIESRSVIDCPDDMRCSADGKVMVNPVRSPYGHLFEKKTLERWITNCGSVCPITNKPLNMSDVTPDIEVRRKIVKFLKGQQSEQGE